MKKLSAPLILASNSPRRKQILSELGFEFSTIVKEINEDFPSEILPTNVPEFLAHKKAQAYEKESETHIVLTSDTVVIIDNQILGKPYSHHEATQMLKKLSGNKHTVITGVCLAHKNEYITFSDAVDVYFSPLTDSEIDYYINKSKPFDKAGAYGIQEWIGMAGIEKIVGSFYTVMGLPAHLVYKHLVTKFGV